jgi:hypothetical protein
VHKTGDASQQPPGAHRDGARNAQVVNDSPIDFQTTPLRQVNLASIDEDHHVIELRPVVAARRAHVVVDEITGDGSSKVAPMWQNGSCWSMVQAQARSGPCWTTRLTAPMLMSDPGSPVPSASMMGLAGWRDVL